MARLLAEASGDQLIYAALAKQVRVSDTALSKNLAYFQQETGAPHAFQVTLQADYLSADCFARHNPTIVPARTFFSQLF